MPPGHRFAIEGLESSDDRRVLAKEAATCAHLRWSSFRHAARGHEAQASQAASDVHGAHEVLQRGLDGMVVQLGSTPTWQDSQVRALRSLTLNAVNVFGLAVVPEYEAAFPDLTSQLGIRSYPALGMVAKLYSIRCALILDTGLTSLRTTSAASVLSEPLPTVKLARLDDVGFRCLLGCIASRCTIGRRAVPGRAHF